MSKKQACAVEDVVFEYLKKQNRPYNVLDIFNNLHKEYGKSAVQRGIDQLVAASKVCEKVYGKQKVYLVNQNLFPVIDESEIKIMDSKIQELSEQLTTREKEFKANDLELSKLNDSYTTEEAAKLLQKTKEDIEKLNQKLKTLAENPKLVTVEEKEKVYKERDKYVKEWRKRKRITCDILNSILEGYPKGKRALYEETGIETDENVGVSIPT